MSDYDYAQKDNEEDFQYRGRLISRAYQLERELEKLRRSDVQGGWISVADRKPDHCRVVLVRGGVAYYKHDSAEWFTISGEDWPGKKIQWEVKHWMPLPNSPSNSPGGER